MGTLEDQTDGLILFMSIDGIHCRITEPRPFSSLWSSHKYGGKCAANYELGILIHKPKLVWVYGPTMPGQNNDLGVFRLKLKGVLETMPGCKVFADAIYAPEPDFISMKNDLDPPEIKLFKNRVGSRHEDFNGFLKNWGALKSIFDHGVDLHKPVFRSICFITMVQIETGGNSLFNPYP